MGVCVAQTSGQETPAAKQAKAQDLNQLSIEELMKIQVDTVYGASKFEQKVTEAPSSVTIITADEIQKYGYRTLADLLQSVPGFYVTNDRNYVYAGVQGISRPSDYNGHILVLIDGHRMNDDIYDSAFIGTESIIDLDLAERVEIIRGPGSSLYGTNAFLGVINVITKRGGDLNGAELSADAGSLQTFRGRASYGQKYANGLELLLSESVYNSKGNRQLFFPEFNSPATNNGIAQDADTDRFHSTFLSTTYGDFTFRAGYVSREKRIPTASFDTVFNDPRTRTIDARAYGDLQYHHVFGDEWEFNARGYYDWYKYDAQYIYDYSGAGIPPSTINKDYARSDWWGVDLSVSRRLWERHRFTLGTEEIFNTRQLQGNYDQQPYFLYLLSQHSTTIYAVYAQDEFTIRKNLLLTAGMRYDRYSTFGGTLNPRLGLIYAPQENTAIKVLYGQAFRAPNVYELYYQAPTGYETNPNLHPETIKKTEIIFERYFQKHAYLSTSGFYQVMHGLISQEPDPLNGLLRSANLEDVRSKGLELQLGEKRPSGWEGRLSYTVQESHQSGDVKAIVFSNSPRHLAKINVIAPLFRQKLFASFEGQEVSKRQTVYETKIGGFFLANATLYSKELLGRLQLSASAYNLFNKRYSDPVGQEFQQQSIPQNGRTFRVKATFRFEP